MAQMARAPKLVWKFFLLRITSEYFGSTSDRFERAAKRLNHRGTETQRVHEASGTLVEVKHVVGIVDQRRLFVLLAVVGARVARVGWSIRSLVTPASVLRSLDTTLCANIQMSRSNGTALASTTGEPLWRFGAGAWLGSG
jgi:hypothetical protein